MVIKNIRYTQNVKLTLLHYTRPINKRLIYKAMSSKRIVLSFFQRVFVYFIQVS